MKNIALFARNPKDWVSYKEMTWDSYLKHYDNIGNLVWTYGIFRALRTPCNNLTLIDPINPQFSADEINDRFDHIVFSFANLLDPQKASRIQFLAEIVSRLKIPITICSIGAQAHEVGEYSFLEPIKKHVHNLLSKCLDRGVCIGARGEFTLECLRQLGFGRHSRTIGCPSFFINGPDFAVTKRPFDTSTFRVVFNDTDTTRSQLFRFASEHFEGRFRYITQGFYLPSERDPIVLNLIRERKLHLFGDFHSWRGFLRSFDLSVSSRIHGTVMALLAGIPSAIVSVDVRTHEMANVLGIPQVTLKELQEQRSAHSFYDELDFKEMTNNYPSLLNRYGAFLAENGLDHFLSYPWDVVDKYIDKTENRLARDDEASSVVELPNVLCWRVQSAVQKLARRITAYCR